MRTSQAALASITRVNSLGETEYLTQWNHAWNAYSLIGGHVEQGETFQQCCVREIEEELGCVGHDVHIAPFPYATLRFQEFSQAAKQLTDYHWQVFEVGLNDCVLQNLPADCEWVSPERIRLRLTASGKPIAEQVHRVLAAIEETQRMALASRPQHD